VIEAIAWDCGNVLATFSHRRSCVQLAALTGGRHSAEVIHDWLFASGRHIQLEEGSLPPEVFLAGLASRFEIEAPADAIAGAYSDIFDPIRDVADLIARLPPELPQLVASNTDPLHWTFCSVLLADLLRSFSHFVLSFEVRARKPSAEFFAALVRRAGCQPGALLFIDDLPANVAAARHASIDSIVFESAAALEHELRGRQIV